MEFERWTEAKVETYFHYVGVYVTPKVALDGVLDDTKEMFANLGGRYRDLFERRNGEWRVLHRLTIYDWSFATPYESGWDFFRIPEGINRGGIRPVDPTFDDDWSNNGVVA